MSFDYLVHKARKSSSEKVRMFVLEPRNEMNMKESVFGFSVFLSNVMALTDIGNVSMIP